VGIIHKREEVIHKIAEIIHKKREDNALNSGNNT
jgi:hypothetical protein